MKKIVRLTENDLAKIVRRVINERQYLMEATNNTTLEVVKQPLAITKTVCAQTDYIKVECQIKNTGTEVAYLSRGSFGGAGLYSEGNYKTTIGGVSKFSDHDNSGVIMPIVPVGKTVLLTMVVNTDLRNWNSRVTKAYNKWAAERNPSVKESLKKVWEAEKAKPQFGPNWILIEYNGGKLNIPVTANITVDSKNSCDAPIDIAKGF